MVKVLSNTISRDFWIGKKFWYELSFTDDLPSNSENFCDISLDFNYDDDDDDDEDDDDDGYDKFQVGRVRFLQAPLLQRSRDKGMWRCPDSAN